MPGSERGHPDTVSISAPNDRCSGSSQMPGIDARSACGTPTRWSRLLQAIRYMLAVGPPRSDTTPVNPGVLVAYVARSRRGWKPAERFWMIRPSCSVIEQKVQPPKQPAHDIDRETNHLVCRDFALIAVRRVRVRARIAYSNTVVHLFGRVSGIGGGFQPQVDDRRVAERVPAHCAGFVSRCSIRGWHARIARGIVAVHFGERRQANHAVANDSRARGPSADRVGPRQSGHRGHYRAEPRKRHRKRRLAVLRPEYCAGVHGVGIDRQRRRGRAVSIRVESSICQLAGSSCVMHAAGHERRTRECLADRGHRRRRCARRWATSTIARSAFPYRPAGRLVASSRIERRTLS